MVCQRQTGQWWVAASLVQGDSGHDHMNWRKMAEGRRKQKTKKKQKILKIKKRSKSLRWQKKYKTKKQKKRGGVLEMSWETGVRVGISFCHFLFVWVCFFFIGDIDCLRAAFAAWGRKNLAGKYKKTLKGSNHCAIVLSLWYLNPPLVETS